MSASHDSVLKLIMLSRLLIRPFPHTSWETVRQRISIHQASKSKLQTGNCNLLCKCV